jgi:thiol-disulfide isomerase/thioredoxin
MRRTAVVAASMLLLAPLVGACSRVEADASGAVVRRVSDPLPELQGESLDGSQVSTADLTGQVLVVNVWATWCHPCEQEQPALVRVANSFADRGVRFLGVNAQDGVAAAKAWVDRFDVPYPSLYDPAGRSAAKLGYIGLPDTYIVDPSGTIKVVINGETTAAQLSGLIGEVLDTASASTSASPTSPG